jgi:hypothetical protein
VPVDLLGQAVEHLMHLHDLTVEPPGDERRLLEAGVLELADQLDAASQTWWGLGAFGCRS